MKQIQVRLTILIPDVYSQTETCDKSLLNTRELIEKELDGLPESLQQEVYDFARFSRLKAEDERFNGLLLGESALAKDGNTPDEDAAWASL